MLLTAGISSAQNSEANLNGKVFKGRATELTPPNVDRMPRVYDEYIRFDNGKIYSEIFKMYDVKDCNYLAAVDDRRMIALKVETFNAGSTGKFEGQNVTLEFSGSVIGDKELSGTIIIRYADDSEIKFLVEASAMLK